MIVLLMGLADILSAVSLLLLRWHVALPLAYFSIAYLVFKSFKYYSNWASVLDFVAVVTFLAAIFGYYGVFSYLMVVWLLQKGIRSLF